MAEIVKLADLNPDGNNANKGTERGRFMLERSLEKLGAGRSILLDKDGRIIAGNKTAEVANEIGLDEVVIVRTDGRRLVAVLREDLDLSDPTGKARELAYADNRVGQIDLDFDIDAIIGDIDAGLDLSDWWKDFEFEEMGVDADEPLEEGNSEPQISRADELKDEWGVELGQLWVLPSRVDGQEHRLICGDCTDRDVVERVMGGELIDCVMTDPPYGVDYDGGTKKQKKIMGDGSTSLYLPALERIKEFANDHIAVYLWYADGDSSIAQAVAQAGYALRRRLIWNKNLAQYGALSQQYKQKHEPILYLHIKGKSPYWAGDATEITVWDADRHPVNEFHPTQKPVSLYERAYKNSSKVGGVVFDSFCGGGSAIIAAENLPRQCRAVEISPAYVAVALQRYYDAFGIRAHLQTDTIKR